MAEIHLSIIIPAYNEQNRLPGTLRDIDKYLNQQNYDYEIIVVSDGSTDRTPDIVKEMMGENKNLSLRSRTLNVCPSGKPLSEMIQRERPDATNER